MKDIEYILATKEIPKYRIEEQRVILEKEYELNGRDHQLSVCMEEFAELIEVICENIISGRVDLIHLKEELVDCWICLNTLSIIFDYTPFTSMSHYYDKDNCLNNCILNLSFGIQKLSKCIRGKDKSEIKIVSVMNTIMETLYNVHNYYNIGIRDFEMDQIRCLKIERCEKRNASKMNNQNEIIKSETEDNAKVNADLSIIKEAK